MGVIRFLFIALLFHGMSSLHRNTNQQHWPHTQSPTHLRPQQQHVRMGNPPGNWKRRFKMADRGKYADAKGTGYKSLSPYNAMTLRRQTECKGLDNLLGDIGIMSYVLGLVGTLNGFFTLLVSFVTQIQTVLSTYFVGVPSSLLTLNTFFGDPSAVPPLLSNAVSLFGLVDTFINMTFATNVNGLVNIFSIFGAIFSFVSLYIGFGSTFPTALKYVFKEILGTDPETLFANYGCP